MQALLTHVITHQPDDPISYFHEEITKIKKEMEELNVSLSVVHTIERLHYRFKICMAKGRSTCAFCNAFCHVEAGADLDIL